MAISNEIIAKAQITYNLAKELGYNHDSAIGVLANVMAESNFNEGASEVGGAGYGLGQWTPRENLYIQGAMLGYSRSECESFEVQSDILLRGDETGQWSNVANTVYGSEVITPQTLSQFKRSTGLSSTTINYMAHWERPSYDPDINHRERRINYAIEFDQKIDGEGGGGKPCFPTSPESVITSKWGWRTLNGEPDFHAGTDFASPNGGSQPIYATQSGTVIQSGWLDGGGYTVTIKHTGDPYYSRYMHMIREPDVSVGDTVTKCQKIGDTGDTGNSFGIHLHFEIAPSEGEFGKNGNTLDPEIYLQMDFGGGDVPSQDREKDLIILWLSDALNGWKY